jgi:hypothetical protein
MHKIYIKICLNCKELEYRNAAELRTETWKILFMKKDIFKHKENGDRI